MIPNFGHWDLSDIWDLAFNNFDTWNFFNLRTQPELSIRIDFLGIFVGHDLNLPESTIPVLKILQNLVKLLSSEIRPIGR